MSAQLATIGFPDHLTIALENRAFREGVLSLDDYGLAEIQRPVVGDADPDEDLALDALFLYDSVLADSRRFDLSPINRLGNTDLLAPRPALARSLRLDLWRLERTAEDGADTLEVEPTLLQLLLRLNSIRGDRLDLSAADRGWLQVRDAASHEAQVLLKRDLPWYLLDAKRNYEGDERGLEFDVFAGADVSHEAAAAFLARNLFWIVEHLDRWQGEGSSNQHLDSSEMWDVPEPLRRPLRMFSRSGRFGSYFRFLQDTFGSLFESGFATRILGVENAYERAPAQFVDPLGPMGASAAARIIRVNLSDVAEYFPLPRNLEEAMETREHPRVVAFRRALDRWLAAAARGDAFEPRLRREVEMANRDLRLLKRWKGIKDHPIYFGVKTAASIVPGLGLATAAVDVVDYFAERWAEGRTAWMVAPRGRLD